VRPSPALLDQKGQTETQSDQQDRDDESIFDCEDDGRPEQSVVPDGEVVLGEIQTAISRQKGPPAQGHPGDEQQGRYEKDGHENGGRRRVGDAHQPTVLPPGKPPSSGWRPSVVRCRWSHGY